MKIPLTYLGVDQIGHPTILQAMWRLSNFPILLNTIRRQDSFSNTLHFYSNIMTHSPVPVTPLRKPLNLALIQIGAGPDKAANLAKTTQFIDRAIEQSVVAGNKTDMIVLPECFNSLYAVDKFREYAEAIPHGESTVCLSDLAKKHHIFIVGGSIPELDGGKIYNTLLTFDRSGKIIAKHRKVHLFDIDIKGGIKFQESLTLTGGLKATVFDMEEFGSVGLGVCYDIRFPELAQVASRSPYNGFAMVYPGAFNTTTGPLHWNLLARARAVDNEIFVILCSPCRDTDNPQNYQAYGHSLVCDPMGNVIAEAGEDEEIVHVQLDPSLLSKARQGIPVHYQRRFDVYADIVASRQVKVSADSD